MRAAKWVGIGIEAVVALAVVIALHGGAFKGAESLLKTFSPEPEQIYLELVPEIAPLQPLVPQQPGRIGPVLDQWVEVRGYAPAERQVKLYVNNLLKRELVVDQRARFESDLPLRTGPNRILAEWREKDSNGRGSIRHLASLQVDREPAEASLVLYAWERTPQNLLRVYGSTDPGAVVEVCEGGKSALDLGVPIADGHGAFALNVPAGRVATLGIFEPNSQTQPCSVGTQRVRVDGSEPSLGPSVFQRTLRIQLAPDAPPQFKMQVTLPAQHAQARWARENLIGPVELLGVLFGVQTDLEHGLDGALDEDLQVQEPVSVAEDAESLSVTLTATFTVPTKSVRVASTLLSNSPSLLGMSGDQLEIASPAGAGLRYNVAPLQVQESDGHVVYTWDGTVERGSNVEIEMETGWRGSERSASRAEETAAIAAGQATQNSPVPVLNRLRDVLPRPMTALAWWLLTAIPYIGCLWLLRHYRSDAKDADATIDHGVYVLTAVLLTVHASVAVVWSFALELWAWQGAVVALWDYGASDTLSAIQRIVASPYPPIVLAGVLLSTRLASILQSPATRSQTEPGWTAARYALLWPLAIGVFALILAAPVWGPELLPAALRNKYSKSEIALALTVIAAAWLLGWVFTYWLLRTVLQRAVPITLAIAASGLMLTVPLIPAVAQAAVNYGRGLARTAGFSPFLFASLGSLYSILWAAIIALAGMWVLRVVLTRVAVVAPWLYDVHPSRGQRWARSSVMFVAVLPLGWLLGTGVDVWSLAALFSRLSASLPILLLVALYALLAAEPLRVERSQLKASVVTLVFAYFLCGGSTNLLFIPVPLLLGWYMFQRQVDLSAGFPSSSAGARSQALKALIAHKDAQQLHQAFRRNAEKKYSQGELAREAFESGIAEAEQRVAAARDALSADESSLRQRVFGAGPTGSPLENALLALRYSVPLMLLYQVAALNRLFQNATEQFPLLEVFVPLARWVAYWAVMAFVFGYVYHALRGNDARSKAWSYGVAILIPTIAILILNQDPILGSSAGERVLRIALFVGYLAVAFDLRVLIQAGYERRTLGLVYGAWPALAYLSSLAALVGLSLGPVIKFGGCWLLKAFGIEVCAAPGAG